MPSGRVEDFMATSSPEHAPAPRDEVLRMDWVALKAAVAQCRACPLSERRTQTVFGVGDENADWLFVGEGPGAEEDAKGEPFVGQAGRLLDICKRKNLTVATAESCTAGLVAGTLAEVPGISSMLDRGFITYSNEAKQGMLGVSADTLARHGAESAADEPVGVGRKDGDARLGGDRDAAIRGVGEAELGRSHRAFERRALRFGGHHDRHRRDRQREADDREDERQRAFRNDIVVNVSHASPPRARLVQAATGRVVARWRSTWMVAGSPRDATRAWARIEAAASASLIPRNIGWGLEKRNGRAWGQSAR